MCPYTDASAKVGPTHQKIRAHRLEIHNSRRHRRRRGNWRWVELDHWILGVQGGERRCLDLVERVLRRRRPTRSCNPVDGCVHYMTQRSPFNKWISSY